MSTNFISFSNEDFFDNENKNDFENDNEEEIQENELKNGEVQEQTPIHIRTSYHWQKDGGKKMVKDSNKIPIERQWYCCSNWNKPTK